MSKLSFTVFLLGNSLFLVSFSYGMGWLIGWLFMGLLEFNREKLLNRIIDSDSFSVKKYIGYLLGVMLWIATPLLIAYLLPNYVNPVAIFGAYFAYRIIMFLTKIFMKGER